MNTTTLTAILLGSAVCGLSQQPETKLHARHVIGLENVKHNRGGNLTVQNGVMQFESGATNAKVPTAAIDNLFIGSETTQAGGKAVSVAKTAAYATPYDSGAVLSLLLRTKVDILTVSYRDSGGGLHAAILALPRSQAEQQRTQLIAAGAHANAPAGQELKERQPTITFRVGDSNRAGRGWRCSDSGRISLSDLRVSRRASARGRDVPAGLSERRSCGRRHSGSGYATHHGREVQGRQPNEARGHGCTGRHHGRCQLLGDRQGRADVMG
jgi:hypothetical protein